MAESEVVRTVREAYETYNAGDVETVLELFHEDVEFRPPPTSPEPAPLHGREAVRQYLLPDLFEDQRAEPLEIVEEGDSVLVTARVQARGSGSGVELDQVIFHVWRIQDGQAVRLEVHMEREQAMAALRG